jgi:hypothetical protein
LPVSHGVGLFYCFATNKLYGVAQSRYERSNARCSANFFRV